MINSILKDTFGYDAFRPMQEEAIHAAMDKKDVLLVLPTGGGKSLCYQIPALAQEGLGIVISPLIALMNDQVLALQQNGVIALAYHSNVDKTGKNKLIITVNGGRLKLLYISPETLQMKPFVAFLQRQQISLIAIDEAHCVSMWGNDFRPDYAKLSSLKRQFPAVPIMAVTATADEVTRQEIVNTLGLHEPVRLTGSFARKNIRISTRPGQKRLDQILQLLKSKQDKSGIIYTTTRNDTEHLASKLRQKGMLAAYYHAGMDKEEREKVHLDFVHDRVRIVCATIAFGMGIDKSNIQFVIHYTLAKNIESYYQEIGRAGRDGSPAEAVLFSSFADVIQFRRFIDRSEASAKYKQIQYQKLDRMWSFANSSHCRTNTILSYFGEYPEETCGNCDNCLNPPETFDGTSYTQMALSAIARTKERLPMGVIIDLLRGSAKQQLVAAGLHKIKTYGVGRDVPFVDWRSYITQMIEKGLIQIDYGHGAVLKLTPRSNEVLFNSEAVELVKFVWKDNKKVQAKTINTFTRQDVDETIFEKLKALRTTLSKQENVPAYVIFPNSALEHMAAEKPITKLAFSLITGVGRLKLEKYGEKFIQEIEKYVSTEGK